MKISVLITLGEIEREGLRLYFTPYDTGEERLLRDI